MVARFYTFRFKARLHGVVIYQLKCLSMRNFSFLWSCILIIAGYVMFKVDLKCTTPGNGPHYYRDCLGRVGDKRLQRNRNRLRVGDRVIVNLDVEVLKAMSQGHGGWVDGMGQVRL